jgi:hypothetical protein
MRAAWVVAALLALGPADGGAAGVRPSERLAAFGELARQYAAAPEAGDRVLAALLTLVDDEVLDSLRSGGPFASEAFIRERLDAFGEAWGGAEFRVLRLPGAPEGGPLTAVALSLSGAEPGGSLRVYGPPGPRASLLGAATHEGRLEVHPWPPTREGAPQLLASWLGLASGASGRPLRLELWRRGGADQVARVWTQAQAFPDGLRVSDFAVRGDRILVRRELRYPGWKPGCDGQTQHEDVYRPAPGSGTLVLARRQVVNAWHQDLQASVTRLFTALAAGDRRSLTELVPDGALRARLPSTLVAEPACEEQARGTTVVVAATEPREGTPAPWSLSWSRTRRGWRLTGATPVLQ